MSTAAACCRCRPRAPAAPALPGPPSLSPPPNFRRPHPVPALPGRNPCNENKMYVGFMDVDTNGTDCPQTWVGNEQFPHTM